MARGSVLVTGGAGYVGSVVVDELLARGLSVRVLDSLAHGSVPSFFLAWGDPRFEFVRGDVRDPEARRSALRNVDAVVHLAAIVGDPACARQPELAKEINYDATTALVDEAKAAGVERFIMASTCSNYGKMSETDLATEDFELRPVSLYAETKVAAETEVLSRNGTPAPCCLRFATVFGTSPRMRFDLTVNQFARDVALKRELVVYGEQFWRPYVHVRDVALAVALALEAPREAIAGKVYNVGDQGSNYRKLDLVGFLKKRFPDATVEFVHKDEDPRDYRVSFDKIAAGLNFKAEWSVEDGIDEVIALLSSGLLDDPYAATYRN